MIFSYCTGSGREGLKFPKINSEGIISYWNYKRKKHEVIYLKSLWTLYIRIFCNPAQTKLLLFVRRIGTYLATLTVKTARIPQTNSFSMHATSSKRETRLAGRSFAKNRNTFVKNQNYKNHTFLQVYAQIKTHPLQTYSCCLIISRTQTVAKS